MVNKQQLVETSWFYASDFIWLYDATGASWAEKKGIIKQLQFSVTHINPKQKFQLINKGERIAILLPANNDLRKQKSKDSLRMAGVVGSITQEELRVTEADVEYPVTDAYTIEGVIEDPSRTYNPRYFSLLLGALDINDPTKNALALYKTVQATLRPASGTVSGYVQRKTGGILPWALVELQVEQDPGPDLVFHAQANSKGDFIIPLTELPALEKDSPDKEFVAHLRIKACALRQDNPDPDAATELQIESAIDEDIFSSEFIFTVVPGNQLILRSANSPSLVVQ